MKAKILTTVIIFLACLLSLKAQYQEVVLKDITKPGDFSITEIPNPLIFEHVFGPSIVVFLGNEMTLKKRESKQKGFSRKAKKEDELKTLYSVRIYSDGIEKPVMLEDKTEEELRALEIKIFPRQFEQPYTLSVNLIVKVFSEPTSSKQSDDAGRYSGRITVKLKRLN